MWALVGIAFLGFCLGWMVRHSSARTLESRDLHSYVQSYGKPPSGVELDIEYRDAAGHLTRRTIHVADIGKTKAGNTCLLAYCYKRESVRTFRVDRIEGIVDKDGVVHAVRDYFRNVFDIDLP